MKPKTLDDLLEEVDELKWSEQFDEAIRKVSELVLAYPNSAEVAGILDAWTKG
jgi:hypothetical protein